MAQVALFTSSTFPSVVLLAGDCCQCVDDAAGTNPWKSAKAESTGTDKWRVNEDPLPSMYVFGYSNLHLVPEIPETVSFNPLSSLSWDSWPPERRPEFDLDLQSFATQPRKFCTWIGRWNGWDNILSVQSLTFSNKATSNPSHKAVGQVLCRHIRHLHQWPQGGYRGHAPQRISCS